MNQYVLLTGGKNNSGDFLIKHRAKELLSRLRPDREIVDYDGWKPLTPEQIDVINASKALLLTGGPALQEKMWPVIYPLTENLDAIRVPVILMGTGWKSVDGSWQASYDYPLSDSTLALLKKIEGSGYLSSVRDYHTMNVLFHRGFKRVLMTGCPALYSYQHLKKPLSYPEAVQNVSFSMGVSFVQNEGMERSMKDTLLRLKKYFAGQNFKVIFHHSLNSDVFNQAYNGNELFAVRHAQMAEWLKKNEINFLDISGSAEKMFEHYSQCDLHIGYRVHAHILMNSISKPSILLNEDGRGKALKEVIGGLIFDAYRYTKSGQDFFSKVSRRLGRRIQPMTADTELPQNLISHLEYEMKHHYPRVSQARHNIDRHFSQMEKFAKQLP